MITHYKTPQGSAAPNELLNGSVFKTIYLQKKIVPHYCQPILGAGAYM